MNGHEVWVVEFYSPYCDHCTEFVPVYQKAAEILKGVVKVGAVNTDRYDDLGMRFKLESIPTVKIFGSDKNNPKDYKGDRSGQALAEAAMAAVNKMVNAKLGGKLAGSKLDVIQLTDDNFEEVVLKSNDMWMVEFYAPWCTHCQSFAPHWDKVASSLKGKIKVGAMDVTLHRDTADLFGINGYPTITYFPPGPKNSGSRRNYEGPHVALDIIQWALDKFDENIPPPELIQIVGKDSFKEACEKTHPLCVISVLPHILDCQSNCRYDYLDILKALADKHKKKMWGWAWVEAGAQVDLEDVANIGGFGYPVMAVVNPKKMVYSILRGSFSSSGIDEFLRDVYYGRSNTAHVKRLPKIVESELWDGKDKELPKEEDIDLSDVVLDEKDEL